MNSSIVRVHLISNSKSGKGEGSSIKEKADRICKELGYKLINYDIEDPSDIEKKAHEAVGAALQDKGIVLAAGGDGTIRSVAQVAKQRDIKFAVIPCGTFNFFARTHQIPEDHDEALKVALTGESKPVRLGEINGKIFLINASLGLYVKAIKERENRASRWGRNRLVATLSTVMSFLGERKLLNVKLNADGSTQTLRTPMVFIGNNALQLRDMSLSVSKCMKEDLLAVVTVKVFKTSQVIKLIFKGLAKLLDNEESVDSFCVESLIIDTKRQHQSVSLDGEIFNMNVPLEIRSLPKALNLVKPKT